jgi:sialidase-1
MKRIFILNILFCCCIYTNAQHISQERLINWKGFEKIEFKLDTFTAFYIKPQKAIAGNPWVWRAHFPNWHTEMDSILLEKGFHVAYINTNNLYGHSKAMMVWDNFYNYLVTEKGFAPKVALEGVSRGGLYVYGWAKRNPDKVSCIYTEAAVCDFTSWPGGKNKGKGSANDWKKLLNIYQLTEDQAINFADQPKDNLQTLAAFKVPILHVVGLKDSVVPAEENSFVLVNNYLRLGGQATIIPMTKGKQELSGHHFPIENPEALADFIYKNNVPVIKPLPSEVFIHAYGNLNNTLYRIQKEQEVTVAFLGGSITNMNGWRNKLMQYLEELYPQTKFTFINAGIPSLGSVPHAFRLQPDVLDKGRIDLMFVESAVNDHVNGTPETQQQRAIEGIIRHALHSNPYMNIVIMAFADEDKIADYNAGKIPFEIKVHDELSKHYHLPFINLAEEVAKRIAHKEFTWEDDFKNLHPSTFGQEIYFSSIKTLLRKQWIDNKAGKLVAAKPPPPLQPLNYSNAKYMAVEEAINKKEFVVDPSWKPADNIKTREGFVNVPMLIADKPGASFDLAFTGTTIGIAVVSGPGAGTIQYTVDGKDKTKLDTYNHYSRSLYLPQYSLLADDLKNKKHVLHVQISNEHNEASKGTTIKIVHFLVNQIK